MVAELDNGAAQPNVSVGSIQKYPLLLPPKDILDKFAARVEQNWTFIDTLRAKIQNLRRTRDLLLPRLLSGQVELS